ncbi:excalibur calcium-binding domain-containing protein [Yinghuangia soli]|uniref:Excalibur calcium-binding domain-containing protein n=1 Tax=Yinghuangia soli TaxID=2908204 RepID=A0AA41U087_9ACTN|nr:excalibur calcium-binding domain-containing protein [Yinghuangia soli]MCF2528331.1 excalibur calcium-binding domain-containing protein [Yinghuangia soli]
MTRTETATATETSTPPPPVATSSAAAADPVRVLDAYFDAVNARDYARAWALGGRTFAATYEQFVADHATKAHYELTVLGIGGGVVRAAMDVTQTDGSHRYYEGTYTVLGGAIAGTTMREVGRSVPSTVPTQASPKYSNCDEVRAAGAAPIFRGQPGYGGHLDRDGDGIACELPPVGE